MPITLLWVCVEILPASQMLDADGAAWAAMKQMRYLARQPIFDKARHTVGYELLFRRTSDNVFDCDNPDTATKSAMDAALLVGLDVLTNGRSIFVNCTRDSLVNGYAALFPPAMTVLEILESVEPDEEVIAACRNLQQAGYRIAVDDFTGDASLAPILELASIIKVDLRLTDASSRAEIVRRYGSPETELLAEKVETYDEFEAAARLGFTLFQGYFFARPVVLSAHEVAGSRLTYIRMMQAIGRPDFKMSEVEQLIKSEPALCYRLLRYLNSAAFSFRGEISSIVHALTLLGEREIRKWLTVTCAVLATKGKPPELVSAALTRARFCELMATSVQLSAPASFMLGLFSLMDAILDTPMSELLTMVPLPPGVAQALGGRPSGLRKLHDFLLAYEGGDWTQCAALADSIGLHEAEVAAAYVNAVGWVQALSLAVEAPV
ncbi:MAG TPA: HDOD domain-containing protein [Terriglobales bacterium]|nr:HDOD domain-containing protein [Terriglobales bacterium]